MLAGSNTKARVEQARERCFACDRKLGAEPQLVDTRDAQMVYVGSECFKHIRRAGNDGWQPPKGGPRLYLLRETEGSRK